MKPDLKCGTENALSQKRKKENDSCQSNFACK